MNQDTLTAVLSMLVIEIIHTLYDEPNWLGAFTRGSFLPDQPNLVLEYDAIFFPFYIPVDTSRTVFEGEIAAICVALEQFCV